MIFPKCYQEPKIIEYKSHKYCDINRSSITFWAIYASCPICDLGSQSLFCIPGLPLHAVCLNVHGCALSILRQQNDQHGQAAMTMLMATISAVPCKNWCHVSWNLKRRLFWSHLQAEGDLSEAWRTIQELEGLAFKSRHNVLSQSLWRHWKTLQPTLCSHDDFRTSCTFQKTHSRKHKICAWQMTWNFCPKCSLRQDIDGLKGLCCRKICCFLSNSRPAISRCSFECLMRLWSRLRSATAETLSPIRLADSCRRRWWRHGSWAISLVNGRPMPFWVRSGTRKTMSEKRHGQIY